MDQARSRTGSALLQHFDLKHPVLAADISRRADKSLRANICQPEAELLPITKAGNESHYVIRLEGEIDVSTAADLKRMLVDAVTASRSVTVDASAATDLDVTAVQLMWATARQAEMSGTSLQIAPMTEALGHAFVSLGFEDFPQKGMGKSKH